MRRLLPLMLAMPVVVHAQTAEAPVAQPDLVPVSEVAKEGRVGVRNSGTEQAEPSVLTVGCVKTGGGACPMAPGMDEYRDAEFPGKWVVKIPALAPGRLYMQSFKFWPGMRWSEGSYTLVLFADAADSVREGDEHNNLAVVFRRVSAAEDANGAPADVSTPVPPAATPSPGPQ